MLDCHLHSSLSRDSEVPLAEYARLACRHRYAALVTAEHLDLDPGDYSYGFYDPARHLAAVTEARPLAPDTFVGLGLEASYQRSREAEIAAVCGRLPYDLVIGSVHYLDDIGATITSREQARRYFEKTPVEEAYGSYFEILLRAAGSGIFDVLGHADICKRYGVLYYGPFEVRRWEKELRAVFRACADAGTGVELNVAGWGQAPGEPYPGAEGLAMAREEGVRFVTVGSDAHDLARFGPAQIRRGLELLAEVGYERVFYWREREAVALEIADLLAR